MTEPIPPLPKAQVLGYFSDLSTPTRVRIIAARGVRFLADLHFAFAVIRSVFTASDIWQHAQSAAWSRIMRMGVFLPPPIAPSITLGDVIEVLKDKNIMVDVAWDASLLAPAFLLFVFSYRIRHGRKIPSILTLLYVALLALLAVFATVVSTGTILVYGLGTAGRPMPVLLFWLLLFPVAAVLILLLKDLCACLRWIARQPAAEKPPVPFLPPKRLSDIAS